VNVNAIFTGLEFHAVWNMMMGFLVWLIIPGIGLLYGGLARRKSSLALLFQSVMVMAVYVAHTLCMCTCGANVHR